MKDIKELLGRYCYSYKGFYLIPRTSKFGVMQTKILIYNSEFRMLYDGKFHSYTEVKCFIDRNYQMLKVVSKGNLVSHDKYNSEYFTGGYNYYGELIDKDKSNKCYDLKHG